MKGFINIMRQLAALFSQQTESNKHVQTRNISEVQSNTKGNTEMTDVTAQNTNEQDVNQIANEALNLAAPFIPGGPIADKVAQISGLTPAAIHLGFVFAHLFSHPKVAPVIAAAAAPAAPPAPVPVVVQPDPKALAIAAIQQQMKELNDKLAKLQA